MKLGLAIGRVRAGLRLFPRCYLLPYIILVVVVVVVARFSRTHDITTEVSQV
jgi:hypothetical protein